MSQEKISPTPIAELSERYASNIQGQIHCIDRLVLNGTFGDIGHPKAMSFRLHMEKVRLLDYKKHFANTIRVEMKERIEKVATEEGLTIQHVYNDVRKEQLIADMLQKRGRHEGVVHILSAMESCRCYDVTKNHKSGFLELSWSSGKCLHYYVYFIDKDYGLCYLRIPTWAPFRLQFYLNGHDYLERKLKAAGIKFRKLDNCFVDISNYRKAQKLADSISAKHLHRRLDKYAKKLCACHKRWPGIHWSIQQIEYATDIVFKSNRILPSLYQQLVKTAINEIDAGNVYCFMGKRLTEASKQEVSSHLNTRVEGTRIKHTLGRNSIKMYDKQERVLRIETTSNDVTFFKHYREVNKRDGTSEKKFAAVKKTIHSIGVVIELLSACNRRYFEYVSHMQDHTRGQILLDKLSQSVTDKNGKSYRGLNFFSQIDLPFILTLLRGEYNIHGFTNRMLREHLDWSSNKISRTIKRFRQHKLIKPVAHSYRYYLTKKAKGVLTAALQLRKRVIIPALA